eukprot:807432-Rhodomonas_salina.2
MQYCSRLPVQILSPGIKKGSGSILQYQFLATKLRSKVVRFVDNFVAGFTICSSNTPVNSSYTFTA